MVIQNEKSSRLCKYNWKHRSNDTGNCRWSKSSWSEVIFATADNVDAEAVISSDVIYLGSPAMGDEVLEDSMEAFFAGIEGSIGGKKIAIFGFYD